MLYLTTYAGFASNKVNIDNIAGHKGYDGYNIAPETGIFNSILNNNLS